MGKYLIDVEIYYKGSLSKDSDIGHLAIQLEIDEAYYKEHKTFIESSNSYVIEGESSVVPVGLTYLFVKSAEVIKEVNIKRGYDESFKFELTENVLKFRTQGIGVFFRIGLPKFCWTNYLEKELQIFDLLFLLFLFAFIIQIIILASACEELFIKLNINPGLSPAIHVD